MRNKWDKRQRGETNNHTRLEKLLWFLPCLPVDSPDSENLGCLGRGAHGLECVSGRAGVRGFFSGASKHLEDLGLQGS